MQPGFESSTDTSDHNKTENSVVMGAQIYQDTFRRLVENKRQFKM